jgi:hypothetical protein
MARDAFERLLGEVKDVMHRQMSQYRSADELLVSQRSSISLSGPPPGVATERPAEAPQAAAAAPAAADEQ